MTYTPEQQRTVNDMNRLILNGITMDAAVAKTREMLEELAPRSWRRNAQITHSMSSVSLEIEHAFSCSGRISIDFRPEGERLTHPIDKAHTMRRFYAEVTLSWPATGRNLTSAMASIELYQQMLKIGALIETVLQDQPIYTTTV